VIRKAILGLLCLSVTHCGPRFLTTYDLEPPERQDGKVCVNNCQLTLQQCEATLITQRESCLSRVQMSINSCKNREAQLAASNPYYVPNSCLDFTSCSYDSELCNSRYRQCFKNCGGTVWAVTQCVSNCEEVQGPLINRRVE